MLLHCGWIQPQELLGWSVPCSSSKKFFFLFFQFAAGLQVQFAVGLQVPRKSPPILGVCGDSRLLWSGCGTQSLSFASLLHQSLVSVNSVEWIEAQSLTSSFGTLKFLSELSVSLLEFLNRSPLCEATVCLAGMSHSVCSQFQLLQAVGRLGNGELLRVWALDFSPSHLTARSPGCWDLGFHPSHLAAGSSGDWDLGFHPSHLTARSSWRLVLGFHPSSLAVESPIDLVVKVIMFIPSSLAVESPIDLVVKVIMESLAVESPIDPSSLVVASPGESSCSPCCPTSSLRLVWSLSGLQSSLYPDMWSLRSSFLRPGLWSFTDLFSNSLSLETWLSGSFPAWDSSAWLQQWGCTAGVGEDIFSDTTVEIAWGWRDFGCSIDVVSLAVDVAVDVVDVEVLDHVCPQLVDSPLDLELSASSNLGFEVWLIWSLSSLWTPPIISFMTSKSSRKPCQVDVKIDSNLDSEVSVVSAFIVAGVDGSFEEVVAIDGSADIHVSGVGRELGVRASVDVNIDDVVVTEVSTSIELVVNSVLVATLLSETTVGGHIVAAWFVLKVPLCVGSIIEDPVVEFAIWDGHLEACVGSIFGVCSMKDFSSLFSTTPSKLDKDVELDILVLWWDGVIYVGLRKFFIEKKSCVDSCFSTCTM